MGFIAVAVSRKTRHGVERSDIKINPLPLGAPFGVSMVLPEQTKEHAAVFGLSWAQPCAAQIVCSELIYDDDLQMALQSLEGPWDPQLLPQMRTVAATIEQTPPTGTIVSTAEPSCPDRSPDSDASDSARD